MKILIATGSSDRPETALLCGLADRGHQVYVFGAPSPENRQQLIDHAIIVEDFEAKSRFDFKAAQKLKNKIQSWGPDIVHAFTGRTLAAAVRAKSETSQFKLVTYRGTVGHLSRFDPASRCSFLSPKVDAISCVSNAVKDYLKLKNIPENKLHTIYKGHNPAWYKHTGSLSRATLGIEESSFVAICVANARPVKGLDIFIDAANKLINHPQITFLIVGDIRDQKLLKQVQNPKIKFLGFRKDAQALIGISDCLIVPSRAREGLPKALLEALALKKPVIASKVGGIPEVIKNEQHGLLLPPEDSALLASTILYLIDQPQKRLELAMAGYKRLIEDFTVAQMVLKTEKLYQKLLQA